jgi:hydrogenase expression/formation protein HypE
VRIVTGDTKVVPRGECDQLFINTSGIGIRPLGNGLSLDTICPGDTILVSGPVGNHGVAILGARNELDFETEIVSDCAALNGMIGTLLQDCTQVKWMRDATRGGLAAVLSELTEGQQFGILVNEEAVPVGDAVKAVCELLGFEPLHLANEGKIVIVVSEAESDCALRSLKLHELGRDAAIIGHITDDSAGSVRLRTTLGTIRRMFRPTGELLPRIC